MNINDDLAIDPHKLDEEWLKQPVLYMQYSELVSKAQKVKDEAKEKIEVTKAELDSNIRSNPEKYDAPTDKKGEYKITEAWITGAILRDIRYQDAVKDFNEKNYELNMLQAAVKSFDHKKKALENIVQLWQGSYFSTPKSKDDIQPGKRLPESVVEKAVETQRKSLKRKSRRG